MTAAMIRTLELCRDRFELLVSPLPTTEVLGQDSPVYSRPRPSSHGA